MIETPKRRLGKWQSKDCQKINRSTLRKHFVLTLIGTLVITFLVTILVDLFVYRLDWLVILTFLAAALASVIANFSFQQTQEIEEARLFHELFVGFNRRYDKLNEKLNSIYESCQCNDFELNPGDEQILFDYFNLCGEEYFCYSKGFIYEEAWQAWCVGMDYFLSNATIRQTWEEEQKEQGDSYYGLTYRCIQKAISASK